MAVELVLTDGNPGFIKWELLQDDDGFRDYLITFRVRSTTGRDGPYAVANCPGLPTIGSTWSFGSDVDPFVYCRSYRRVYPEDDIERTTSWYVDLKFSNRPLFRCDEANFGNPLLEPQRVSGTFNRQPILGVLNRDGSVMKNSSHQPFKGQEAVFDGGYDVVRIEQNVPVLGSDLWGPMRNTVNGVPMWGLPARCVKLSGTSWALVYYGTCQRYFVRSFEFELFPNPNPFNPFELLGWDRRVQDRGTLALKGHFATESDQQQGHFGWIIDFKNGGPPDPANPQHFVQIKDDLGHPLDLPLNGEGVPADNYVTYNWSQSRPAGAAAHIDLSYYQESNFFLLGIPINLENP